MALMVQDINLDMGHLHKDHLISNHTDRPLVTKVMDSHKEVLAGVNNLSKVIKDTSNKVINREVLIHMVHGQLHHSLAMLLQQDSLGHQDSPHQARHHMVEDMDKHQQEHHPLRHTQLLGDRHHTQHLPRLGHLQDIMEIIVLHSQVSQLQLLGPQATVAMVHMVDHRHQGQILMASPNQGHNPLMVQHQDMDTLLVAHLQIQDSLSLLIIVDMGLLMVDTVMQEIMEHHSLPQDMDLRLGTTLMEAMVAHQEVDTKDQAHHHQLHHTIHTDDNLNKTINVVNNFYHVCIRLFIMVGH